MQINWKVRVKNPMFWVGIVGTIISTILVYLGMNWNEITTWAALGNILLDAVKNPVIVAAVLCSVYNAIVDPTTKGLGDSVQAMTYTKPKSEGS